MRGEERRQRSMLLVINLAERVPEEHPLRRIKQLADAALKELSPIFDQMYSALGRPSIPPERLLQASLLMALYTIRSERMFCEQLTYNLLFRWFLDMELDEQGLRMKIAGVFDGMEADVIRGVSWQSGGLHVGEEFGGRILSVGRSSL